MSDRIIEMKGVFLTFHRFYHIKYNLIVCYLITYHTHLRLCFYKKNILKTFYLLKFDSIILSYRS